MEGRANNFKKVLNDFESRLAGAECVAIDTELTGVDLEGEPDTFEESADVRVDKLMRIAERYTMIQLGLTVVSRATDGTDGKYTCASYNLFAFPYVGPEMLGREPGFFCQASSLQFNATHRVDFNRWIGEGIPYMSREEERRYMRSQATNGGENHVDEKVGLLRLWRSLCTARVPLVVHGAVDLFFLLVAFEKSPLPRQDPRALAMLIRQCTPKVYDTAHLHGQLGRFKRLGLFNYFEDVQANYEEMRLNARQAVPRVEFDLIGDTASRYSKFSEDLTHEAGFDSLVTAQLFVYLRAISPGQVKESANKLFLFRSVEFLDLDKAAVDGKIAQSMFDLTRVTLLVAALDPVEGLDSPRHIGAQGITYKWMDGSHVLVVLRASGGAAVRKAAELAAKVPGVLSWMPFEQWRQSALQAAWNGAATRARVSAAYPSAGNPSITGTSASASNADVHAGSQLTNGRDEKRSSSSTATLHQRSMWVADSTDQAQRDGRECDISLLVAMWRRGSEATWMFRLFSAGAAASLLLALVARHRQDGCRVPVPLLAARSLFSKWL